MFTKTILATATAALISAGSLGATTTTASAGYVAYGGYGYHAPYGAYGAYGGYGNHGWFFNFGYRPVAPRPVVQKVCAPTYRTVEVWRPHFGWVWQTVSTGVTCHYAPSYPSYPHIW